MAYAAAAQAIAGGPVNAAGGVGSFAITDLQRLRRFLILGSEGGTYYSTEPKLTLENAEAIARMIQGQGETVVAEVPLLALTTFDSGLVTHPFCHFLFADPCRFARRASAQAVPDPLRSRHGVQAG